MSDDNDKHSCGQQESVKNVTSGCTIANAIQNAMPNLRFKVAVDSISSLIRGMPMRVFRGFQSTDAI